jgi:hypothetical protein
MMTSGLIFGLVGVLCALRGVAVQTLPHILTVDPGINYQEVTDGLPAPYLLNWDLGYIEQFLALKSITGPSLWLFYAIVVAVLWLCAARTLNPTFRLFYRPQTAPPLPSEPDGRPEPNASKDSLSGAVDMRGVVKAARILAIIGVVPLIAGLPAARTVAASRLHTVALNPTLTARPPDWAWSLLLIGVGFAIFIGLSSDGVAGDFAATTLNRPGRALRRLTALGFVWGVLVTVCVRCVLRADLEPLLTQLQSLGTFNIETWQEVAAAQLIAAGACAFTAGAILPLLAAGKQRPARTVAPMLLPVGCLAVAAVAQHQLDPQRLIARYDMSAPVLESASRRYTQEHGGGVPDGPIAAAELARRLHLPIGQTVAAPPRSVLMFMDQGQALNIQQNGVTVDGLAASPEGFVHVRNFLRGRHYRSALSWAATKYLIDLCTLHFDTTSALDTVLDDLAYGPHLAQTGQLAETLFFICAATPRNIELLDKWADTTRFAFPDRPSRRLIGDLYRRFGAEDKALEWYRKADMPHSFLKRVQSEQPLFHEGHTEGILRLNGRPLAGVQVGLVPWRLNGLPPFMEPSVAHAKDEILSDRPTSDTFGAFQPPPFAFRWISAADVTDARGHFAMDHLTEGQYRLICTLPPQIRLTPPFDAALRVTNPPIAFALHYGNRRVDLGVIDLTYTPIHRQ